MFVELISVSVRGFKRFARQQTLKTEGKLVAILGPNESGKTSLLDAINKVGLYGAFDNSDLTWDIQPPEIEVATAFLLSAEDHERIGRSDVRVLKQIKRTENIFHYSFEPWPERDKTARYKVREAIRKFADLEWTQQNLRDVDLFEEGIRSILELAQREDDSLSPTELEKLQTTVSALKENISEENRPKTVVRDLADIDEFLRSERNDPPHKTIYDVLKNFIPKVVYFSDDDRYLADYYSISDLSKDEPIPKSLANLLALAQVNLDSLLKAHSNGRNPEVRTILERANNELRKRLSPFWSQGEIEVRLNYDDANLNIGIVEKDGRHSDISQRSDGLRQFMALVSFLGVRYSVKPIVLIDEVERTLHYDAQADLIQVLEEQSAAAKIIYTTHSAGALPSDLGRGAHLIKVDEGQPRHSKIENRFWSSNGSTGFQPLLIGLGASTLAFFPTRRAVVCEGPSEMLLLPAIFREVSGANVEFQVVPGLASVSETQVPALAANAKRVCYLTDSDPAGDLIVGKLQAAGVDNKQITQLRTRATTGFTLEDLVSPVVLIGGARRYFSKFKNGDLGLTVAALPATGRIRVIKAAFEKAGMTGFSKIDLAYDVLEFADAEQAKLVEGKYRQTFLGIYRKITQILAV